MWHCGLKATKTKRLWNFPNSHCSYSCLWCVLCKRNCGFVFWLDVSGKGYVFTLQIPWISTNVKWLVVYKIWPKSWPWRSFDLLVVLEKKGEHTNHEEIVMSNILFLVFPTITDTSLSLSHTLSFSHVTLYLSQILIFKILALLQPLYTYCTYTHIHTESMASSLSGHVRFFPSTWGLYLGRELQSGNSICEALFSLSTQPWQSLH